MAVVIVPKVITGQSYYRDVDEPNDQIAIQGLVRAASGAADLYTDANTTTLTVGGGAGNTSTRLRAATTLGLYTAGAERVRVTSTGVVHIGDQATSLDSLSAVQISASGLSILRMRSASDTASTCPGIGTHRSRGTLAAPAAVQSGDALANFVGGGYIGATTGFATFGFVNVSSDGAPTDGSSAPGRVSISTVPSGGLVGIERMRVDSAGRVNIGGALTSGATFMTTYTPTDRFGIWHDEFTAFRMSVASSTGADAYGTFSSLRSRGSHASKATVQNGDGIARWLSSAYVGAAGSGYGVVASVDVIVDGAPSATSSPGRLSFRTTPSGSLEQVERWRITSAGHLLAGTDNSNDIGAAGATRPRSVYVGTSAVVGATAYAVTISTDGSYGYIAAAQALSLRSTTGLVNIHGQGASGLIELATNGAVRWQVTSAGHLTNGIDNNYDIGTSSGGRPRSIYARTSFIAQGASNSLTLSDGSIAQSAGALTISTTDAALTLNGSGAAGVVTLQTNSTNRWRLQADGVFGPTTDNTYDLGSSPSRVRSIYVGTSIDVSASNIVTDATTGTKIGTATTQKLGFWNAAPVAQQTSAALTNNVTSGGTDDQIDDFTDLSVYANDAAAIRNDIYQLARKLKEVGDALRLYGILG